MRVAMITVFAALTMLAPDSLRAEGDHASHHPPTATAGMGSASATPAMGSGSGTPAAMGPTGGGMMAGMAGMMAPPPVGACAGGDCETGPSKTPIYPSLMTLPALTPEKHAEIDALATQQIAEGMARLATGSEALHSATETADNAGMQRAIDAMRIGLDELGAGVAARRVLFEGKAPRNLALDWFKREMNLASPTKQEDSRGWFGVTPFHLFTMVLLVAFALVMLAMYFFKMRRAAALFGRLEGGPGKPPPGSALPLTGVAGSAGAPPPPDSKQTAQPAAVGSSAVTPTPAVARAPTRAEPPTTPAAVSPPQVAAIASGRDAGTSIAAPSQVLLAAKSPPSPASPVSAAAQGPSAAEPRGAKP